MRRVPDNCGCGRGQGYRVASGLIRLRGNLRAVRRCCGFLRGSRRERINHRPRRATEIARWRAGSFFTRVNLPSLPPPGYRRMF